VQLKLDLEWIPREEPTVSLVGEARKELVRLIAAAIMATRKEDGNDEQHTSEDR
jgi:hypothetical protein